MTMSDMQETVGNRIVRIASANPALPRERKALAEHLGVEYETLRKWCRGLVAPNRRRALLVAERLGVPVETVMFGTPSHETPAMDAATTLEMALSVVGAALGATAPDQRAELGDLLRQWAQYGGRPLYRDLVSELMGRGQRAGNIGELMRPLSPEALRVARLFDSLPGSEFKVRAYAHMQSLVDEAENADPEPAPAPQAPRPVPAP